MVMGLRTGEKLDLTVAMPLISGFIKTEDEYFKRKGIILSHIKRFTGKYKDFGGIGIYLNALDERGRGLGGIYLSLLCTPAENADSGQVGRGNRVNGLISINRPMGTEAAAGKNPVSHVGKIYNVLAHMTAEKIYKNTGGIKEVYVILLSRIGTPIDRHRMACVQVLPEKGVKIRDISKGISLILEKELSGISVFCDRLASGRYSIC